MVRSSHNDRRQQLNCLGGRVLHSLTEDGGTGEVEYERPWVLQEPVVHRRIERRYLHQADHEARYGLTEDRRTDDHEARYVLTGHRRTE